MMSEGVEAIKEACKLLKSFRARSAVRPVFNYIALMKDVAYGFYNDNAVARLDINFNPRIKDKPCIIDPVKMEPLKEELRIPNVEALIEPIKKDADNPEKYIRLHLSGEELNRWKEAFAYFRKDPNRTTIHWAPVLLILRGISSYFFSCWLYEPVYMRLGTIDCKTKLPESGYMIFLNSDIMSKTMDLLSRMKLNDCELILPVNNFKPVLVQARDATVLVANVRFSVLTDEVISIINLVDQILGLDVKDYIKYMGTAEQDKAEPEPIPEQEPEAKDLDDKPQDGGGEEDWSFLE